MLEWNKPRNRRFHSLDDGNLNPRIARASADLAKQNEMIVCMVRQRTLKKRPEDFPAVSLLSAQPIDKIAPWAMQGHAKPCSASTVTIKPDLQAPVLHELFKILPVRTCSRARSGGRSSILTEYIAGQETTILSCRRHSHLHDASRRSQLHSRAGPLLLLPQYIYYRLLL